jgi:hypothetical protein
MSKKMAGIIMAYGVVLAALGLTVRSVAPELARITFIASVIGGGLYVLWGVVALAGHKRRVWVILTMVAVFIVMLTQTIQGWLEGKDQSGTHVGALLVTVLLILTAGMLMYVMHGERPQGFYTTEPVRRENPSGGNDTRAEGGKHSSKQTR